MKKHQPKYYLDTNAVINLDEDLLDNKIGRHCYIPSTVIYELVKNVYPKNFHRQKLLLGIINDSKAFIDWRNAEYICMAQAWGKSIHRDISERNNHRMKMRMKYILKSETYCDYRQNIIQDLKNILPEEFYSRLKPFFEKNKDLENDLFNKALSDIERNLKYESFFSDDNFIAYYSDFLKEKIDKITNRTQYRSLYAFCKANFIKVYDIHFDDLKIAVQHYWQEHNYPIEKIRYTGLIDVCINGLVLYFMKLYYEDDFPHRNDSIDIDYLVFMTDEYCNLVTNDKLLLELAGRVIPGRVFKVEQFRKKLYN